MNSALSSIQLSPQQAEILEFLSDSQENAIIVAVAGSGKTTTLRMLCQEIDEQHPTAKVAFLAFNKKIADDIGAKLKEVGLSYPRFNSGTFHSFGNRVWMGANPFCNVDAYKIDKLCDQYSVPSNFVKYVKQLVSLLKQHAFNIGGDNSDALIFHLNEHHDMEMMLFGEDEEYDEEQSEERVSAAIAWSKKILRHSVETSNDFIDFDDMLYMPLLNNLPFPQYDYVLLDEAQDTNSSRRIFASRLLSPTGRFFAVGDPHQAIYGFAGANSNALDLIADEFHCTSLPLTVSWRCAKNIVEHAQRWVSHIQAAPTAVDGVVREISHDEFNQLSPEPGDAILCRNTNPLVSLALGYLRRDIPATIEGKDIGESLAKLCTKWKRVKTVGHLMRALDKYCEKETKRLRAQRKENQIQHLEDQIDAVKAIASGMGDDQSVFDLKNKIKGLFTDTDTGMAKRLVVLSTVHKAKGREWDRVYLYGRNKFMPSFYAKQEWELQQENNLIYVAVTRAKVELIEVNV